MALGHRLAAALLCCLVVAVPAAVPSEAVEADQTPSLSTVQQAPDENVTTVSFPPNTTWENEQTLEAYTTGGTNFSARPPNATWKDCCPISRGDDSTEEPLISDAYVAIFATSPSTIAHTRNGTQRYGSPSGTVRTISNLRLNLPGNDSAGVTNRSTNASGNSSVDSVGRSLTRFDGETELLVNGTVVDSEQAAPVNRLQYEDVSGTVNLTVRTTFQATIRVNESNSTERRNYSMTVTDSRLIRVQNLSAVPASQDIAWINDTARGNQSVIATTIPGTWHEISFADGPTVTSKWRYYTQYNESWQRWDTWETVGNRSAVDGPTRVAPQEVHAVPVTAGPEMSQSELATEAGNETNPYLWIEYPDSQTAPQPPLPPGIQVDRTNRSTTADTFTIHSDVSLRGLDAYTVHGIVRGHTVDRTLDTSDPATVRKANLTAEMLSSNGDTREFQVRALAREGQPILQGRISLVTKQSSHEQELTPVTGSTMVVKLNQSESSRGQMKYVPLRPWWNQSRRVPVRTTTAYFVPPNKLPPDHEIIGFLFSAVVAALPIVLLLYGYRIMHRGKLLRWNKP